MDMQTRNIEKIIIQDSILYYADCWDVFDEIGEVDTIVTDPPYGINVCKNGKIGETKSVRMGNKKLKPVYVTDYGCQTWDKKLDKKYIDKMLLISKNQIIFGGNYYADWLPPSSCWIVWDKENGKSDFADCELIYTSFKSAVRKIKFKWNGFCQADMKNKEKRIYPTQKPEYIMKWIIASYTKKTDLILDPFMGSGSTGVACTAGKRKFIGIEKEKKSFDIACERIDFAYRKLSLF